MRTVSEALEQIITEVKPLPHQEIPLHEALGLTLAETLRSDRNNPPFDKALMDGYAVRSEDLKNGRNLFEVIEEVTAGQVPSKVIETGKATRIMTGAPLPDGADLVVPFEESTFDESSGNVELQASKTNPGSNMMPEGAVLKKGDTVLEKGTALHFQQIGALAEIGQAIVKTIRRTQIAILATGDELVDISGVPGPGQIRNSNGTMLRAQSENAGANVKPLGIARDLREEIESKIRQGLESDILILSGGVSAGKLDLVPSALQNCGVREIFHKVKLKPGKPVWFGIYQESPSDGPERNCYVFGLPGNPVGSMVCFELFVRTAIRCLSGVKPEKPETFKAILESDYSKTGDRELHHPCSLNSVNGENRISLIPWQGSADLQSTVLSNGLAIFPEGDHEYRAGDLIDVILF